MQSEPQCVPCVIKQCERLVYALRPDDKESETTERILSQIRHHALENAAQLTLQDPPSKFTSQVLVKVYELLNTDDPYVTIKKTQNETGKKIYGLVQKEVNKSPDPIHYAIKYAACGNIIDVGPAEIYSSHDPKIPLPDEINTMAMQSLVVDDYKIFKEKFRSAEQILYILDNSGEIFLDKLLIEKLKGPEITMVVKSLAILNDATKQDAIFAGLDGLGKIITVNPAPFDKANGDYSLNSQRDISQLDKRCGVNKHDKNCRYLGVDFSCTTDEFNEAFDTADIVIAKGHANFESLVNCERDCFFILMAKCPVVAQKLGVNIKDRVFYYSPTKGD
jgi:uncharacterized protein with ATP-grasp and redox domains